MADQTVYFGSTVSGDATSAFNAVGSTSGTWAGGALNSGTSWTQVWAFTNPTENQLRAETQTVTLWLRKGTNSGNPTIVARVLRGGVELVNSGSRTISSTTGQAIQVTWTPTAGESSQDVQLEIVCTAAGGSPSVRNSAEIDYGYWLAKTQAGAALTPVSDTLSTQWNVLTPVTDTFEFRYNTLAGASLTPVTDTLDTQWIVKAAVNDILDTQWGVKAAVTDTLSSQWGVLAGVQDALSTQWNVAADAGTPSSFVSSSRSGQSDSNTASNTCPVPAGAAAGMTAILAIEIFLDSGSTPVTPTWPSGFELWRDERANPSNGVQLLIAKKTLTAADSGNYVTGLGATRWNQSICALIANGATVSLADANSVKTGSGTAITGLSLSSTQPPVLLHFQANSSSGSHTPPSGFTERQDSDYLTLATREPGTTGAHSTSGAAQTANTAWAAALIAVEGGGGGGGLTAVSDTLDTRWGVRAAAQDTLDTRWTLRSSVADTLSSQWNVKTAVNDALDSRWNVLSAAADSLDTRFNVRSATADTLDTQWGVRAAASDTLDTRWGTRAGLGDTLDTRWGVRAPITKSLASEWNLASSVLAVQKNLDTRFNLRAGVADTLDSRWHIRTSLGDTLDTRWNVRRDIADTLDTRWGVRAGILDQLDTRFNIAAAVTKSAATAWNTGEAVTSSLATGWNVQAEVGAGFVLYKRVDNAWVPMTLRRRVDGAWV